MASICTSLRWLGFEGAAGLGEECLDEGGPVLDALEPARLRSATFYIATTPLSGHTAERTAVPGRRRQLCLDDAPRLCPGHPGSTGRRPG
jgi:hypothetical protein